MEFVSIVKDLGIPVALLCGIGWGLWHGISWFGTRVIIPIQERHFIFLTKLEAAINQISEYQLKLTIEIERLSHLGCARIDFVEPPPGLASNKQSSSRSSKNIKPGE